MNGWGIRERVKKLNLFYKTILTSPKGLSTGLPDMVVPHRYVSISVKLDDCFIYISSREGIKYKVETLLRRSEDRLVKNSPEGF